jgi:hypothetical protein
MGLNTYSQSNNYHQVLYAEGKKPGLITYGKPFIFVEINRKDSAFAYIGYHPYKGNLYDGCWLFNMNKINDSTFMGIYETNQGTLKFEVKLTLTNLGWILNKSEFSYNLTLLENSKPTNYIRNKIYATSFFEVWCSKRDYKCLFECCPTKNAYSNKLFELPFSEFIKIIYTYNDLKDWNDLFY